MEKIDEVREGIIHSALTLFNTKGICQTSIQDIMDKTQLPKGAIYRRFVNKEAIILAAFEKGNEILWERLNEVIHQYNRKIDQLLALPSLYSDAVNNPPVKGGCPLLNAAVESDNYFPQLQKNTYAFYKKLVNFVQNIINQAVENGELSNQVDSYSLASFIVSSMEGAIMSSRLSLDNIHISNYRQQLTLLLACYK